MINNKPITAKINKNNHLEVGGCDLIKVLKKHGSPLWIIDKATIEFFCKKYISAFQKHYDNVLPLYANKALSTIATTQLVDELGFGFDVVSGGELYTVKKAGVNLEKVYFHGNNKSEVEIELAIESGLGRFVADNPYEIERINRIAKEKDKVQDILIRITPEVEAHTHEFIQTGQLDSKFGVTRNKVIKVIQSALKFENINIIGVHAHIGSQIFDAEPFKIATEKLCDIALEARKKCGVTFSEINVGGGLGIKYLNSDDPADIEHFAQLIGTTLNNWAEKNNFPKPKLLIEPGRSIVANAGMTLYTIGSIKEIEDIRTYVAVDGGMADNARPITYGAEYDATIVNKASDKKEETYTVAGKFCESGDIILKDIQLQKVEIDDILGVYATGAYNYSMASNYNRFCKPAMVMLDKGKTIEILKRETFEDIIRNDIPLK